MQKKCNQNKNSKIRNKVIIFAVAVMLAICTLSLGVVVAKYFNQKNSTGKVGAAEFYFTSNLLDGKEHTFAPGTTSVTFTLGNHADDLRFAEVNIAYTVTVNNNGAKVSNGTGTIEKGAVKDVEVTVSNLQAGTYTITAVGTGGYKKTLTATIIIPEQNKDLYYKIDTSVNEYILLTVWNEGETDGTVTISYTGIPDNTNPNMADWLSGVNQNVTIKAHESKVYRFFGGEVTIVGAEQKTN